MIFDPHIHGNIDQLHINRSAYGQDLPIARFKQKQKFRLKM